MKKFVVTMKEIHSIDIEVEANSIEEAREKVSDMIYEDETGRLQETEYSYMLEPEEWNVEEKCSL